MNKRSKPNPAPNRTVRGFRRLARDYYDETLERFPVQASDAGLKRYNSELGRATPEVQRDQIALDRRTLAAIESMPIHDFESNDRLDRMTLLARLRTDLLDAEQMQTWRTNPQIYLHVAAEAIHSLIVRNPDSLKRVAPAIITRLRSVPRFLDEAASCIRTPVPLWTKLACDSAPGIVALFESLHEPLAQLTDHRPAVLKRWIGEASEAVRRYARRVSGKKPGAANGFSVGKERFEFLMRERLGLSITAGEARASALGLAEGLAFELKAEARRFHPRKSAAEILEAASGAWRPVPSDLVKAYEKVVADSRRGFRKHGAMTFPRGDRLLVKAVPEFMKDQFPTAAYLPPGPLDSNQTGIFWVNDLSRYRKSAEAKQAEIAQHFGIELTAAHEAYPGHHLQFIAQNRHPSLVRRFAAHAIYYEGWTLWCEQMCVDLKIFDNPYIRLIQLHDALWRACRIVIDCGLQTGELTFRGACRVLQDEVGFTASRAAADVNWYTSSPTVPMSYLLGKMELLRLKRQRVDQGGWTLREFNDWVLGFGAIPWSWIEASGL